MNKGQSFIYLMTVYYTVWTVALNYSALLITGYGARQLMENAVVNSLPLDL